MTPFRTTLIFGNIEFADAVSSLKSHLADFREMLPTENDVATTGALLMFAH